MTSEDSGLTASTSSLGPSGRNLQSSQDFAQRIKQLDIEGRQLINTSNAFVGSYLNHFGPTYSPKMATVGFTGVSKTSPGSLSALADITQETKTISEMRANLDAQRLETERLQRSLQSDSYGAGYLSTSSLLSSLDVPQTSTKYHFSSPSHTSHNDLKALDYNLGLSKAEQELKASQDELQGMRSKLREAIRISEQQRNQYVGVIEDLKLQVAQIQRQRDQISENRQKENSNHESTISRLRTSVKQLEDANRVQEETLLELNAKLETLQKDTNISDTLMAQIRTLLLDREHKRGHPFYEAQNISSQSTTMLAHSLERCFQELETEAESSKRKLGEVQEDLEALQLVSSEKLHLLTKEHQTRLTQLTTEHSSELTTAVERSSHARQQNAHLQDQLDILQKRLEKTSSENETQIKLLETQLENMKDEKRRDVRLWEEKKVGLEQALDELQRELSSLRQDRNESISKKTKLDDEIQALKQSTLQLESELLCERDRNKRLQESETSTKKDLEVLASKLESKIEQVSNLEAALASVKQNSEHQLQISVANAEVEHRQKHREQLQQLESDLVTLKDEARTKQIEFEVLKTEHNNLLQRHASIDIERNEERQRYEEIKTSRDQLDARLNDRVSDVERLTTEKEYYFKLLGQKDDELAKLRDRIEKINEANEDNNQRAEQNQLEMAALKQEVTTLQHQCSKIDKEKEALNSELNKRVLELEEMSAIKENLLKKSAIRERHLVNLEDDNMKLASTLKSHQEDQVQTVKEKDVLYQDLCAARLDIDRLKDEKRGWMDEKKALEDKATSSVEKLKKKVKALDHELKLSQKALQTHREADANAVRVAGKMQKEVTQKRSQLDALQTKLHWLQESLENHSKEKKVLLEENDHLSQSLKKLAQQNERLTADQISSNKQLQALKDKCSVLEGALDKAAVKNVASISDSEMLEQNIARLKLKHQLELKELERSGSRKDGQYLNKPLLTSSIPPKPASPILSQPLIPNSNPAQEIEKPVKLNPTEDKAGASEMRELLKEMKRLVQNQQQINHLQTGHMIPSQPYNTQEQQLAALLRANIDSIAPELNKLKQKSAGRSKRKVKIESAELSKDMYDYKEPTYHYASQGVPNDTTLNTELLLQSDVNSSVHFDPGQSLQFDAKRAAQRLEEKLQTLSDLGNHLQRENRDLSALMVDQDRKLKQIRENDKLLSKR